MSLRVLSLFSSDLPRIGFQLSRDPRVSHAEPADEDVTTEVQSLRSVGDRQSIGMLG